MSNLFWLMDEQMARLRPFFPKSHGKPRVDDRRVLSGIIFINRNGLRWSDAPKEYGPAKTLYNRWKRWGHMRFIVALQISHSKLMRTVQEGQQNTAYLKCLAYLRRLMPDLLSEIIKLRLKFMCIILTTSLAAREAAFENDPTGGKLWSSPHAMENLIASISGVLEGPFPLAEG